MRLFHVTFNPSSETEIIDVGGTPYNWNIAGTESQITLVNLFDPKYLQSVLEYIGDGQGLPPNMSYELGDGTNLRYPNEAFDIYYSNSVIEHLGTYNNQVKFAKEARRVAKKLWVQTPARGFIIEPHLITPFIHFLPKSWQKRLVRNFTVWGLVTRPSPKEAEDFLQDIRLISIKEMKELFPDCVIVKEKFWFFTKSYIAVRG
jgi:hypothetical protein